MQLLLNGGGGDSISHLLGRYADAGFRYIRQQPKPGASAENMQMLLDEFRDPAGPKLCWLAQQSDADGMVEAARIGAASTAGAIEGTNEPDLKWPGVIDLTQDPQLCRDIFLRQYEAARMVNPTVPILCPAVSNLNDRGLDYLAKMDPKTWPQDVKVAFHRYNAINYPPRLGEILRTFLKDRDQVSDLLKMAGVKGMAANILEGVLSNVDLEKLIVPTNMTAHKKPGGGRFITRGQEMDALRDLVGDRELWLTETGYSTARQEWFAWTEEEVAQMLTEELAFMEAYLAVFGHYQWTDGEEGVGDPNERFGVVHADGSEKLIAKVFKDFVQTP